MSHHPSRPRRGHHAMPARRTASAPARGEQAAARALAPAAAPRRGWLLIAVRYVLPATVALAGLVIMAMGSETDLEGGAGLLSAGLAIYFLNWLFRAGAASDLEREAEDAARDYYDLHGRWPD